MVPSTILAALAFIVSTTAGFAASAWMDAHSPANDACIGCPLVVIAGVVIGSVLAAAILLQARKQTLPGAPTPVWPPG